MPFIAIRIKVGGWDRAEVCPMGFFRLGAPSVCSYNFSINGLGEKIHVRVKPCLFDMELTRAKQSPRFAIFMIILSWLFGKH